MEVILKVVFNSQTSACFEIKDPPVLPLEGESFSCKWGDYISDEEALDILREYDRDNLWFVSVIDKFFRKTKVIYTISLMEEDDYRKYRREYCK